jgi:hypothetical protein
MKEEIPEALRGGTCGQRRVVPARVTDARRCRQPGVSSRAAGPVRNQPGMAGGTWTVRAISMRSGDRPSRRARASPVPSLGWPCVASAQDPGTVTAGRRFDDAVYLRCGMWARWSYDEPFGGRPVGLWLW